MIKLHRFSAAGKEYWQAWQTGSGGFMVHWGELGTRGQQKSIENSLWAKAGTAVEQERQSMLAQGFSEIEAEAHCVLLVEYAVEGMGNAVELDKRHRLQDRLNETLGWTGPGACDGGSIGSGTIQACAFVVDFDIAKKVLEADLAGTEFADYTRIYDEENDE